jgi:hypothetical protein
MYVARTDRQDAYNAIAPLRQQAARLEGMADRCGNADHALTLRQRAHSLRLAANIVQRSVVEAQHDDDRPVVLTACDASPFLII